MTKIDDGLEGILNSSRFGNGRTFVDVVVPSSFTRSGDSSSFPMVEDADDRAGLEKSTPYFDSATFFSITHIRVMRSMISSPNPKAKTAP